MWRGKRKKEGEEERNEKERGKEKKEERRRVKKYEKQSFIAAIIAISGGLLDKIMKTGKLVVSTAPKYPPQSELQPDGTFTGFDVYVATEIAKPHGVTVEFVPPHRPAPPRGRRGGAAAARQRALMVPTLLASDVTRRVRPGSLVIQAC